MVLFNATLHRCACAVYYVAYEIQSEIGDEIGILISDIQGLIVTLI